MMNYAENEFRLKKASQKDCNLQADKLRKKEEGMRNEEYIKLDCLGLSINLSFIFSGFMAIAYLKLLKKINY